MNSLTIHLDDNDAMELKALARLSEQNQEDIVKLALRQYMQNHPLRAIPDHAAISSSTITPVARLSETQERRKTRMEAKRSLSEQDIAPIVFQLDGEVITDGLEYQKRVRAEW